MTTYTQLGTDLTTFAHQDLSSLLPRFVALAEDRMNRVLRVREMEADITGTIDANGEIALPSDFRDIKTIWVDGYEGAPLLAQSLEAVIANDTDAPATLFAVTDAAIRFNGTGSVTGVYYKSIPGLQANSTNWLSTSAYQVYLAGTLEQAYRYTRDAQQEGTEGARFEKMMSELNRDTYRRAALVSRKV